MTRPIGRGPWTVGARNREDLVVVRVARSALTGDPSGFTEHTLPDALVWPESSSSDVDGGQRVDTTHKASVGPDADVVAGDRIRRPSDPAPTGDALRARAPWQVVGKPARWTPGTVIDLREVDS